MGRSLLIGVITAAVVAGAAPSPTIVAADAVVVQTADQTTLTATSPTLSTTDTVVGLLVDGACYLARGAATAAPEHAKCATRCAQKGSRLAVVTSTGAVYVVTGILTENNNAKLIPLVQRIVVLTGTVSAIRAALVPAPVAELDATSDYRRPSGNEGGVIAKRLTKAAAFREGDNPDSVEMSIDALTADLATVKLQ